MAEGLDGLAQDLAVDGDGECDGGYAPVRAWFSPQWFSFRCDTLIDHIQLKQYIYPPQVVHSPPDVGDWRVETALELRLYGLACPKSDTRLRAK